MSLSDNNSMDKDAYIKQLEKEIVELKKRIEELERLLGMNSTNSSRPPSSDPPGIFAVSPKRRRKKRGAKKGHQPHLRELLPPEKVKKDRVLPPGVEQALVSARQKYEQGKPLGYDIKDMIEAARQKKK